MTFKRLAPPKESITGIRMSVTRGAHYAPNGRLNITFVDRNEGYLLDYYDIYIGHGEDDRGQMKLVDGDGYKVIKLRPGKKGTKPPAIYVYGATKPDGKAVPAMPVKSEKLGEGAFLLTLPPEITRELKTAFDK